MRQLLNGRVIGAFVLVLVLLITVASAGELQYWFGPSPEQWDQQIIV